ncbi:hypothetical protein ACFOSS_03415 [Pseudaeromonas sharmana]|uniref:Uncharacterized protein n=1 Tax=Pseudaeromonas sharmana TaxID=328412 RepID=A0ABV8CJV5_9GAMM
MELLYKAFISLLCLLSFVFCDEVYAADILDPCGLAVVREGNYKQSEVEQIFNASRNLNEITARGFYYSEKTNVFGMVDVLNATIGRRKIKELKVPLSVHSTPGMPAVHVFKPRSYIYETAQEIIECNYLTSTYSWHEYLGRFDHVTGKFDISNLIFLPFTMVRDFNNADEVRFIKNKTGSVILIVIHSSRHLTKAYVFERGGANRTAVEAALAFKSDLEYNSWLDRLKLFQEDDKS